MLLTLALVGGLLAGRLESHTGIASWYGPGFYGLRTASGEVFKQSGLTAAHRSLPFGTKVLVSNLKNGRYVWVIINDRGPYVKDRIIDLSRKAAEKIDLISTGTEQVRITIN